MGELAQDRTSPVAAVGQRFTNPRLALIGLGRWGRHYPRLISQAAADIVVCHTRRLTENVHRLASEHPEVEHTTSLTDALDRDLDGVIVATPTQTHACLVRQCLDRGLHVLVEKPTATSLEDVLAAHAEARARGLVLRTGYTHCHDSSLHALAGLARAAAAPSWLLQWRKPAPGTGALDIVWEYFPHVLSIAALIGGGIDPYSFRHTRLIVDQGPNGTGSVRVDLPTRNGVGRVEVSTDMRAEKRKHITLFDDGETVAMWQDRLQHDLRREETIVASEEPLMKQLESFIAAILTPGVREIEFVPSDVAITELLLQLHAKVVRQ